MQMLGREGCPKHMAMGPCGGVQEDGGCEVIPEPCVFDEPATWPHPVPAVPLRRTPLILADYSADPYSVPALTAVAGTLAAGCDAVLVGEHQNRPDFPPTMLASMLQAAGARPWMTLACRDRNRSHGSNSMKKAGNTDGWFVSADRPGRVLAGHGTAPRVTAIDEYHRWPRAHSQSYFFVVSSTTFALAASFLISSITLSTSSLVL